jgi:hypothetical protein
MTAADFGDLALMDIKNLDQLAVQFYNNICKSVGRGDFCFKYVDLQGVMDHNWPNRRVDVVDIE